MKKVSVTELRRDLHAYVARARNGERVRITCRAEVIAELVPPTPSKKESDAARARLRGSVLRYDQPLDPVIDSLEWNVNR